MSTIAELLEQATTLTDGLPVDSPCGGQWSKALHQAEDLRMAVEKACRRVPFYRRQDRYIGLEGAIRRFSQRVAKVLWEAKFEGLPSEEFGRQVAEASLQLRAAVDNLKGGGR